jgi:hypothetical protein
VILRGPRSTTFSRVVLRDALVHQGDQAQRNQRDPDEHGRGFHGGHSPDVNAS